MSEIGEIFSALKHEKTLKKVANLEFSTELLVKNCISFDSKSGGTHLIIKKQGSDFADFWPSTGKYKLRGSNKYKRGVLNLLKEFRLAK